MANNSDNSNDDMSSGMEHSSVGPTSVKRRKQDPKTGKGLRHFSMKVCEKVKFKGTTTYNEVADELVSEFSSDPGISRQSFQGQYSLSEQEPFDQKNIRRRVYDALNVLMAMNIISKEKKEIKWIGLPTNAAQECSELEEEKRKLIEKINTKRQQVHDLILQQIAYKKLVERNRASSVAPAPNAIIKLPFIIITTDKKTVIDCSISNDKSEYLFNLDNAFEIHDDIEVLKRMGLTINLEKLQTLAQQQPQMQLPEESSSSSQASSNHENNDAVANHAKCRDILPKALHAEFDEMIVRTKMEPVEPERAT